MAEKNLFPHPFSNMLQFYYVDRLRKITAKRKEDRKNIRTRQDAEELVAIVKKKIKQIFEPFPKRTPLNPKITGILERRTYQIEKIIFESRPNFLVTGNLYIPKNISTKMPAVLGLCGHARDGKAAIPYQSFCQGLALKGYVVFIIDPISQGERLQFLPEKDDPECPKGDVLEHNVIGSQLHLIGEFFGTWRAWDAIRALDYLFTRPEVDRTRVGVTGNSGGGTLSTYVNALEDRITMAAPGCFITTYLRNMENELPADSEQIPPHVLALELDMADFLIARAPRPAIILTQKEDFFDVRGAREAYEDVRRIYRLLGKEKNIQLYIGPQTHGYSIENREAMYGFFNCHAKVKAQKKEPPLQIEKESELFCASQGQVHFPSSRRVLDHIRDCVCELQKNKKQFSQKSLKQIVSRCLGIREVKKLPQYRKLKMNWDGNRKVVQNRFGVETESGIVCTLFMEQPFTNVFHFEIPEGEKACLYIPHLSSSEEMAFAGQQSFAKGRTVFALDPRGIGESRPLSCSRDDFFHSYDSDYFYASHGIMLDEFYISQKVHDVLSVLALLKNNGYKDIHLAGKGLGSLVAAFTGVVSANVNRITLINPLLSYAECIKTAINKWPLSHLVPGILLHLDLPDIYRFLETKKLCLINPWTSRRESWKSSECLVHLKALGIAKKRVRFSSQI